VVIWQANTNVSQEELSLGEWYQNRQEWNQGTRHFIAEYTRSSFFGEQCDDEALG
jgi:hypothetical protein